MSLVIDASVAFKWFVKEDMHDSALDLLGLPDERHSPDLLVAEVANIAWRKWMQGEMEAVQARFITEAVGGYFQHELHSSRSLAARAQEIALALEHPVYDALYLACAERIDGVLITADRRLLNAVAGTELSGRAVHLTELPATP